MKFHTLLLILCFFCVSSCLNSTKPYGVFDYEDFGPQSMVYEKIGMEWWQWNNHGSSDPNSKDDIKVVVYRDMPLSQIKSLFPVSEREKKDFRYFEFSDAIQHLNESIKRLEPEKEEWAINLKKHLIETKKRIIKEIKVGN